MADDGAPNNQDSLSFSDTEADDTEDLFASPSQKRPQYVQKSSSQKHVPAQAPPAPPDSQEEILAAHEENLRRELGSLRSMNTVISGINASLEKAKSNMETVSSTVNNASTLLTTWTRILSQTEHNQRLILNPSWQGASQDIADGENEELLRRQEKERKEVEEERRAKLREVEREEEERRRTIEAGKGSKGRGGKVVGRRDTRGRGYVGVGGQGGVRGTARGGSTAGRSSSGIGRGFSGNRGVAKGV